MLLKIYYHIIFITLPLYLCTQRVKKTKNVFLNRGKWSVHVIRSQRGEYLTI